MVEKLAGEKAAAVAEGGAKVVAVAEQGREVASIAADPWPRGSSKAAHSKDL